MSPEVKEKLTTELEDHEFYECVEPKDRVEKFLAERFLAMATDFKDTLQSYSQYKNRQVWLLRVMINSALAKLVGTERSILQTFLSQLEQYNTSKILKDTRERFGTHKNS